jgi:predicted secreted protein with PEFG-CTERM motif
MKLYLFVLFSILIGSFTTVNVYADSITVSTNKEVLTQPFEKFLIEGKVVSNIPLREVNIKILDPNGNLVYSPTSDINDNGEFVNVGRVESSWSVNGIYTIEVSNQKLGIKAIDQIELQVKGNTASIPVFSKIEVSGLTVEHSIGITFESVQVDFESKKITFDVDTQNNNQLTLKLPQKLITDPKTVIIDGTQISNFQITKSSDGNTLIIPLGPNSKQIEIIGVSVIPEFGSMAIIILAVAITAITLVMRKSFKVIPKLLNP